MFVTKRIHPGAFPMNGKFTRLLFLKTAKSKKRKTCRNIFFFRTIPTIFPTYICICWPMMAYVSHSLPWTGTDCPGNKTWQKTALRCPQAPHGAQKVPKMCPADTTWAQKRPKMCPAGTKSRSREQNRAKTCPRRKKDEY